jgi:exonuclease III
MSYRIGSFNLKNFSNRVHKDLNTIVNFIISERLDIVALQEVLNYEALVMILRRLPQYWEGSWSRPRSSKSEYEFVDPNSGDKVIDNVSTKKRSTNAMKGYAYLWNTHRIKECSKSGPQIFDQIKNGSLVRNPYCGRFTSAGIPGGSFFEIRLINVHLCSPAEDKETRLNEYNLITDEIYSRITSKRYGNNMPSYTIILGDYNMPISWCTENIGNKNQFMITEQDQKTTLKKIQSAAPDNKNIRKTIAKKVASGIFKTASKMIPVTNISFIDNKIHKVTQDKLEEISGGTEFFANDYDHFSYDGKQLAETLMKIERINIIEKYLKNNFTKYQNEISDHVPILMEFEINGGY